MKPLSTRALLVFLFDLGAVSLGWFAAFWFRLNLDLPPGFFRVALHSLLWVVPVYGLSFLSQGLYRGLWLFASLPDLFRMSRAVSTGGFVVLTVSFLVRDYVVVPRTVLILSPLLTLLMMSGARVAYRSWKERGMFAGLMSRGEPVLLLGAGLAGATLARELHRSADWRVVGLLDDDPYKLGREVFGCKVLGRIDEIDRLAAEHGVTTVIIALPSASEATRRRIGQACVRAGLRVLIAPRIGELADGRLTLSSVRRIGLEDLLGREPVTIDGAHLQQMLRGKVVLVSGAGGSIGSEICRQLVRFGPAKLLFLEQHEFALYRLQEEFELKFPGQATMPLAGDVKDAGRLARVMAEYKPDVVFHAAAYKHVPLMERLNAWQAVMNNVVGTHVLAQACVAGGVGTFVLVSTDKAVNPVNVMGATKRLAEMICQALQQSGRGQTRFKLVRFGNVIGSAGSVIPKFQEQIERGGPVTVTDPEVTRYFMSIPEAAQLVLQAASMGEGGEIYVMDMGQAIRIADLARDMIRLSGRTEQEVHIDFTGLRPGEKLIEEEVLAPEEQTRPTRHPKLRIARARSVDPEWLLAFVGSLHERGDQGDDATRRMLARLVPEYRAPAPQEAGTVDDSPDSPRLPTGASPRDR